MIARANYLACVDTLAPISAKLVATGRRDARPGAGEAAREALLAHRGLPEALCYQPLVHRQPWPSHQVMLPP